MDGREVSVPEDTFGVERLCDNECEGCRRPQDVYCWKLNGCREEKVNRQGGSSGLLSNDGWGKASERSLLLGSGCQALAWDGRATGREEWMLIHLADGRQGW